MKTVRLVHRLLAGLKAKWLFALVPLLLGGCVQNPIRTVNQVIEENAAYKEHYAHSDFAKIRRESSWSEGVGDFYLVDGSPVDAAGFPYSFHSFTGIFVPPGPHRLLIKISKDRFSLLEINVTAHHAYRIAAAKSDHGKFIQLWDETAGRDKRTLQQEFRNLPEASNFFEAVRTFKAVPDSAMVTGETPSINYLVGETRRKIDRAIEEDVLIETMDGRKSEDFGFPVEMMETRFVSTGTHRLVLQLEEFGFVHHLVTLPEIEVEFLASHIYRITAKKTSGQHLVEIWDETEGWDQRTLVKDFHCVTKKP